MEKVTEIPVEDKPFVRELKAAMTANEFYKLDEVKIKIVDTCNLRCVKCNHWTPERRGTPDQMTPLNREEWQSLAEQIAALGPRKVKFSGGEPTLHPALAELTRFFSDRGVTCSVTTNGTLLDKGLGRSLVEAGMAHFRVSVDGPDAASHDRIVGVPGAFERVKSGLAAVAAAAKDKGIRVKRTFNTLVTRTNLERLAEMVDLAGELGLKGVTLLRLHSEHLPGDAGSDLALSRAEQVRFEKEMLPELIELGRKYGVAVSPAGYEVRPDGTVLDMDLEGLDEIPCFDAWYRAAVFPAGDVFVCCHSRDPRLFLGNAREAALGELLQSRRARAVRERCFKPGAKVPDCRRCDLNALDRLLLARWMGYAE